jgi:hypothetical protein
MILKEKKTPAHAMKSAKPGKYTTTGENRGRHKNKK